MAKTKAKRVRRTIIRDPLPGHTCRTYKCQRSMEATQLTKERSRANRSFHYGAIWGCPRCNNTVWTPLSQQDWSKLTKRYPDRVVEVVTPSPKTLRKQAIAERREKRDSRTVQRR